MEVIVLTWQCGEESGNVTLHVYHTETRGETLKQAIPFLEQDMREKLDTEKADA